VWKRLTHPNILPLLGITVAPLQLISDWMSAGDLPGYIKKNPGVDRLELVGVRRVVITPRLLPLLAIGCRQGPLLPPLLQCHSWGPQGSTWFQILFRHRIDIRPAKYSCGQLWSCKNHGFWPRHGRPKYGFHMEHPAPAWSHCAMGCSRNLK
jgi:hypothetical protein